MTDGDYQEEIQRLRAKVAALTADNAAPEGGGPSPMAGSEEEGSMTHDVGTVEWWRKAYRGLEEQSAEKDAQIAALVADNAALLRGMLAAHTMGHEGPTSAQVGLSLLSLLIGQPHPGAALLEAHRKALEAARYADDNAKAFTQAFCETAEAAVRHALASKGGQHVPFHGDFANVPPSAIARLRWWAACGRAALNGETSGPLARLARLDQWLVAQELEAARLPLGHHQHGGPFNGVPTFDLTMHVVRTVRAAMSDPGDTEEPC